MSGFWLKPGDRIKLVSVMNDPDPIPFGSEGTVKGVSTWNNGTEAQIDVKWDSGRTLMVILPEDKVRKV